MSQLTEEQRRAFEEMQALLEQKREELQRLAEQMRQDAEQAKVSPLTPPDVAEVMEQLQQLVRELAQRQEERNDVPVQEQMNQARDHAQQAKDELESLQQQIDSLQNAREQYQSDAQQAREQLERLREQIRAEQAAQQLDRLGDQIQRQRQELQSLAEQTRQLADRTAGAQSDEQLNELGGEQQQLEQSAMDAMQRAEELMGERPSKGERRDTPANGDAEGQQPGSREQIRQRQEQLGKQLQQRDIELGEVGDEVDALASELRELARRMNKPGEDQRETNDGEASAGGGPDEARRELRETMQSPRMQRATAMAQRKVNPAPTESGDQTPPPLGQAQDPGTLAPLIDSDLTAALLDRLTPQQRAALYRLPEQYRQRLLQGMHDRGPEGYQPLIDAYFRHLSQEAE